MQFSSIARGCCLKPAFSEPMIALSEDERERRVCPCTFSPTEAWAMDVTPESERHEMQLQRTLESGAQEWLCATCGRRLLMSLHSEQLNMRVLERGDGTAIHAGGTGGLRIGVPDVRGAQASPAAGAADDGPGPSGMTYH